MQRPAPRGARRARAARPDVHVPASRGKRTRRSARATASTSRSPFGNFVDGWDAFVGLDDDGARAVARDARRVGRVRAHGRPRLAGTRPRRCASDARTVSVVDDPIADAARAAQRGSSGASRSRNQSSTGRGGRPSTARRVGRHVGERAARDRFVEVHASSRRATGPGRPRQIGVPRHDRSSGELDALHAEPGRDLVAVERFGSGDVQRPVEVVAHERLGRDRGDVARIDPRDPARRRSAARRGRGAAASRCLSSTIVKNDGCSTVDATRRRREPAFDRAVVAVQSVVEPGDRDVRDLHDALDAGALGRLDRVGLQRDLIARRRRHEEHARHAGARRGRATSGSREVGRDQLVDRRAAACERRRTTRAPATPSRRELARRPPPELTRRTDHEHRHGRTVSRDTRSTVTRARAPTRTGHRPTS